MTALSHPLVLFAVSSLSSYDKNVMKTFVMNDFGDHRWNVILSGKERKNVVLGVRMLYFVVYLFIKMSLANHWRSLTYGTIIRFVNIKARTHVYI